MPDLENLLREELRHEAQKVQPELLRPLQVPTRQPSWRPRLLPFAAAAAVIAVITAGALVAGLITAHKPAARKPAVSGSAPAGLPRFYVTTSSGPGGPRDTGGGPRVRQREGHRYRPCAVGPPCGVGRLWRYLRRRRRR